MADMSNNPNVVMANSGSGTGGGTRLSFPSDIENIRYSTMMTFVQYRRDNPASNPTERIVGTVMLPIPLNLIDELGVNYNAVAPGVWGGIADILMQQGAIKSGQSTYDTIKKMYESGDIGGLAKGLGALGLAVTPATMRDSTLGAMASSVVGAVVNPHVSLVLDSVQLRQHSLSWLLSAKNADEANTLARIINFIKQQMLPDYNSVAGRFALDFPKMVYIKHNNVNTGYKDDINKSFITSFSINAAPFGPSFRVGGNPNMVEIRMNLMETEIRTANSYSSASSDSMSTGNQTGSSTAFTDSTIKSGPR